MDPTLRIGPLAIPLEALIWVAGIWLSLWVAIAISRRRKVDLGRSYTLAVIVGLLVARFWFVLAYPGYYIESPMAIFNIRDGGWSPWAGFAAVGIMLGIMAFRGSKRVVPLFWALFTVIVIGQVTSWVMQSQKPDSAALSNIPMTDLQTLPVDLSLGNKPTVINLWASWCPPCVREMPALEQAQAENPDVDFIFLNQGETSAEIEAFLQKHELTLENVFIDHQRQAATHYSGGMLPTTLFVDADGKLEDVRLGELSRATIQQRIKRIQ